MNFHVQPIALLSQEKLYSRTSPWIDNFYITWNFSMLQQGKFSNNSSSMNFLNQDDSAILEYLTLLLKCSGSCLNIWELIWNERIFPKKTGMRFEWVVNMAVAHQKNHMDESRIFLKDPTCAGLAVQS